MSDVPAGPDPRRVTDLDALARELDLLRRRAATGTRKGRISLTDLATRVGLPRSTVHTYVTAATLPAADVLDRIVIALGASPAEQAQWSEVWYRVARQLHDQRRSPSPATQSTPRLLPLDIPGFTGRRDALTELDTLLTPDGGAVVISAVAGTAGVGKTALAVHWAHRVAGRFPDGQLFVNLRGYDPREPVRPVDALAWFLRALGVPPGQVPAELDEAALLYRSLVASRHVLVVLDNAGSAEQVRPLLPGAAGCAVLVTSREDLRGLTALDGARPVRLDTLPEADSLALLARMVGADRLDGERSAAAELAALCGHLPLALRIVGAHLASHPKRSIDAYARDLARGDRIDMLAIPEDPRAAIRTAFDLSYRTLTSRQGRLFRALGMVPGPDFTASAAAAVARCPVREAEQDLDRLATAHLVSAHPAGRYACHDLLRLYATERAEAEESAADRDSALLGLLTHYLHTADAARRSLYPHQLRVPLPPPPPEPAITEFTDAASALRWLEAELLNLTAAIRHAADTGRTREACLLADTLRGYFPGRGHTAEWFAVATTALRAAVAEEDPWLLTSAHLSLADAHAAIGQYTPAIEHSTTARTFAVKAGWADGESTALSRLGVSQRETGRLRDATACFRHVLEIDTRLGSRHKQVIDLMHLGVLHAMLGDLEEAAEFFRRAHGLGQEVQSPANIAMVLQCLGNVHRYLGRLTDAVGYLTDALAISRTINERGKQAGILDSLAGAHTDAGRHEDAVAYATQALTLAREVGARQTEVAVLATLGTINHAQGKHEESVRNHTNALTLATTLGHLSGQLDALIGLAGVRTHLGDHSTARTDATRALALARRTSHHLQEGQALTALADNALATGDAEQAAALAREAITVHDQTGYRLGKARTLRTLGRAAERLTGSAAARPYWQAALALFTEIGTAEAEDVRDLTNHFTHGTGSSDGAPD
ncbi:ATP-binding protein [Actinophytocola sp.]|uniref:ATP-binding protein n=1 Tax=Actinophytocola sp. TaxID=1872138 RepID=UPI002ED4C94A